MAAAKPEKNPFTDILCKPDLLAGDKFFINDVVTKHIVLHKYVELRCSQSDSNGPKYIIPLVPNTISTRQWYQLRIPMHIAKIDPETECIICCELYDQLYDYVYKSLVNAGYLLKTSEEKAVVLDGVGADVTATDTTIHINTFSIPPDYQYNNPFDLNKIKRSIETVDPMYNYANIIRNQLCEYKQVNIIRTEYRIKKPDRYWLKAGYNSVAIETDIYWKLYNDLIMAGVKYEEKVEYIRSNQTTYILTFKI